MNRIYKVVWSKAKNCYVVASELAKRHTKAPGSKTALVTGMLVAFLATGITAPAMAAGDPSNVSQTNDAVITGSDVWEYLYQDGLAIGSGSSVSTGASSAYVIGTNSSASAPNAIVIGSNASATASGAVAIGSGSKAVSANTVSFGDTGSTRRLVNISNGTSATDASTVSQTVSSITLSGSTLQLKTATGSQLGTVNLGSVLPAGDVVTYDDSDPSSPDYHSTITLEGPGVGEGTLITGLADGNLAAASTDAVTGAQLYATNQQIGTLVTAINTNTATIGDVQTDVSTLKTNYTTMRSDVNTLQTQVETGFNVNANGAKVKQINPANNYINFKSGDNVVVAADGEAVKISATGTGTVAAGDTGLVTGDTVASETRPASDGNYITATGTAGANLTALDTAVKANEDAIDDINDALDDKANITLDNIHADGETVIKNNAKEAINVVGTGKATVTKTDVSGVDTYTVDVTVDGQVASGDTGIVDGGTVYDAMMAETRPAADGNYITAAGTAGANLTALDTAVKANEDAISDLADGKANVALDNITDAGKTVIQDATNVVSGDAIISVSPTTENGVKTYTVTANISANGQVASGDTGLVSGDTVYTEVRPASDGNYIATANTTGDNLTALDTAVKANEDAIADLDDGKANVDLDNITPAGETVVKDLAKEAVKVVDGTNTTVTEGTDGDAKTYAVNTVVDGVVESGNTGIVDGGTVADALQDAKDEINDELDLKANKDASNVAGNTADWGAAIGTGVVESGNGELVTGGTVYDALQAEARPTADGNYITVANTAGDNLTALDTAVKANEDAIADLDNGKANVDLDNITNNGKNFIKSQINVVGGDHANVVKTDVSGVDTYTVNVTGLDDIATHYVSINSSTTSAGSNYNNDGATGTNAIAIGAQASATKEAAVAIGYKAKAEGNGSFAFGENATATGTGATAFTGWNEAAGQYSMAWGFGNVAGVSADGQTTYTAATAFGTGTEARNKGATAMGNWSIAEGENSVAMGNESHTHSDAKASLAMGQETHTLGTGAFAGGTDSIAGGFNSFAHGETAEAVGTTAVAMGTDAKAVGDQSVALGYNSQAYGDYSVAILGGRTGNGTFEYDATTEEYDVDVTDNAIGAIAAGYGSVAMKDYTVALGRHATVMNDKGIALGEDANVVADSSAALGAESVATEENVISVGHKSGDATYNGGTYSSDLTRRIVNVADGVDDTDAVTVGQLNTQLADKADADLGNITDDGVAVIQNATNVVSGDDIINVTSATENGVKTYTVTANITADGQVATGDTGLVSGDTVYNEVRPDDGNYVAKDSTTAENLTALDTAVKANEDAISDLADDKANIALDNITNDGKEVIKENAKEAINVVGTNKATVTKTDVSGVDTYTVDVTADGTITAGDVGIVTGGTVYDAIQAMGDTKLNTDLSNISEPGKDVITGLINVEAGNDNTEVTSVVDRVSGIKNITVSALSNGQVAQGDTGIVSGGTVYDALQSATDDLQDQIDTKANRDMDNLTTDGERVLQQSAISAVKVGDGDNTTVASEYDANGNITYKVTANTDGVVANADTGIVSGGTVFAETRVPADGNYITAAGTAGQNISALDTALKATNDAMQDLGANAVQYDSVTKSTVTLAGEDGTKITNVKAGELSATSTDAVNGSQLFETNENVATNTQDIADLKDLSNITSDGETVVKELAKDAVKVEAGDRVTVTDAEDNTGAKVYTVSANNDGTITAGDTNLVSGDTVYQALQDVTQQATDALAGKANVDASNVTDAEAWGEKIAVGEVAQGDVRAVSGDTVYQLANDLRDEAAGALDGKANTNLDNINDDGKTVVRELAQEAVKVIDGTNTTVVEATDGNAKTYAVNVVTDGQVASGDIGVVSGDTVYNAIQDSKTKYFGVNATSAYAPNEDGSGATGADAIAIGTSPMAMGDKSISVGTMSATMGEGAIAVGNMATALSDGAVAIGDSSQAIMNNTTAIGAGAVAPYENSVAIGAGSEAKEANVFAVGAEGKERRIVSVAAGTADTDAVNVAQMNAMADDKADTDLSNITPDGEEVIKTNAKSAINVVGTAPITVDKTDENGVDTYTVSVTADGVVEAGNTGLVTGDTVYNETRVARDGNYVTANAPAKDNIMALDDALKEASDVANEAKDGLDGKANTDMDNLTDAGKTEVRTLAQEAVKVVDGEHTTVTEGTDGDAKTYAVNVTVDGRIEAGDTGLVDGGTVYNAIGDAVDTINNSMEGKADTNLRNINQDGETVIRNIARDSVQIEEGDHITAERVYDADGNSVYKVSALTDGIIANGDTGIVSGGTVYTETRPVIDGNYIAKDNTAGENLTALDSALKDVSDIANEAKDGLDGKADTNLGNITTEGETVIKDLAKASVKVEAGEHVNVAKADQNGVDVYTVSAIVDGQVADGNTGIVDGGTVYNAIKEATDNTNDALDGKANVALDNLNTDGERVLQQSAISAVKVVDGENTTVTSEYDANGNISYKVKANATGAIEANNTGLVDGGTVYDALQDVTQQATDALNGKANVDASNVTDAQAWGEKIATGEVAQGDVRAVSGDTVYNMANDLRNEAAGALDGKANVSLDNITEDGKDVITGLTDVVSADDNATVTSNIDRTGKKTYTITVNTNGQVVSGDTGIVTGNTVYEALQTATDAIATDLDGKANVDLDNISEAGKDVVTGLTEVVSGDDYINVDANVDRTGKKTYTVTANMDGQIAQGDTGIVTGGQVYDAIQGQADATADALDGKANVGLDNLDANGEEKLQTSAQTAVKVGDGVNTVATSEYDADGNITYKVEAKATGAVEANNTGLVDGGTVYNALQDANGAIDDKLADKANVDASNVTNAEAWGEKIATGEITVGDVRAVSGDTVYNALQDKMSTDLSNLAEGGKDVITGLIEVQAGNDNTKVESNVSREGIKTFTVSALSDGQVAQGDTGIVTGGVVYDALKDATDTLQEAVDGKANVGLDNLSDAGKTVIQQGAISAVTVVDGVNTTVTSEYDANGNIAYKVEANATGAVEANNTGLVDGGTVYDALQEQAGNVEDALAEKANVDASNVTDSEAWADKLGTGEVAENNKELVTGGTVYNALKEVQDTVTEGLDGKANVGLDNLSTDGKRVMQQSAITAVKTEAGNHTEVTPSYDADGNISYKVDVKDDGVVESGNTGLVTGGTVADALQQASADTQEALDGKANVGLDNITTEGKNVITGLTDVVSGDNYINVANATDQTGKKTYTVTVKMDGSIAENDTGLVTGGQVYDAIKETEDGLKEDMQELSDSVTEGLDTKANRDMDNLTDAGKEVLQNSAQEAVKVEAGNSANVTSVYDADGNISYKVDVVTDGQAQAGDTHAVSGDTLYNAISDMQDASDGKANVSLDNIDNEGKKVITGLTDVTAGNANTEVTSSYDADGKKTYVVSALVNGQVAEGNEGIVSGGTVYEALKEQSDAMAEGLDGKANVNLDNLDTDGKNFLRTSAQEAVTVSGEGNAVVTPSYDANGNINYKVSITEGEVGANETGLVTGNTVYEALQEQAGDIDDKLAGKANVELDNITSEGKDVITNLTEVKAGDRYGLVERDKDNDGKVTYSVKTVIDGQVAEGDEGLVTGGDVYSAVDDAKSELQDSIDNLADETEEALDTKANKDMDNLTDTGKGAIKVLAQDAVQVAAGDNVNVTSAYDANGNKIYTVSALGQGTIAVGDTGLVTGGTVFTETRPAVDGNFIAKDKSAGENLSALDTAIKDTRDMIEENNSNAVKYDSVQKNTVTMEGEEGTRITNLKDARLTSESTDAVTGRQLAETNDAVTANAEAIQEVRDTIGTMEDGEYISADGTVAENLKALDDALVAQEEAVDEKLAGKANTDMDNLTDTGKQNVKDLAKEAVTVSAGDHISVETSEENGNIDYKVSVVVDGQVAEGNTGLVDGGTVYEAIQAASGEIDEKLKGKANTNLDNITDEGREVIRETMAEDLATKANVDASNVTDAYAWGEKIATGEVADDDTRAVSGDTVKKAMDTAMEEVDEKIADLDDKKADKDLGNITPEGEEKIKEVMAEPLAEKADKDLGNLSDEGKGVIREAAQEAVGLEDGETTKVSSRIDEQGNKVYKVEALAEGKIEKGDTRAISGNTMAEFVESKLGEVKDGNHVKAGKPMAENINALDAAIGTTEDGFFVKSDATVGQNLNALDEQVARNTQNISGLYENQKVMTKEMREGLAKSAALAGLHPFENDSDQKWNIAAALGGYKGEHAGAVGFFYRPTDRVMISAGSTVSDSDNLYNVGMSVALDKGSGMSKAQLKKRVGDLEEIIKVMAKKIDSLESKQMALNGMTKEFPDVPKAHWAHEAVANLHGSEIIQGYPDGEFKGEKPMSRYEYAEMLFNAINSGKDVPKEMLIEYKEELRQIENNKKK